MLVKCEEELPSVDNKDGEAWLRMAREWSAQYHECKERNNTKVDILLDVLNEQ